MLVDTGRAQLNEIFSGLAPPEGLYFCLYTNTVSWVHNTVIGGLTEAAWSGYARQLVPTTGWNPPAADATFNQVSNALSPVNFTNATGITQTAIGYFVVGASSGKFYGGNQFTSALAITAGQTVSTFPQLISNSVPASP